MHGASRRRRRRGRLHRLLRKLHAQRNRQTSGLVGLWDECIADERVPELGGAALLYWTRHGGDRTVAKSSWLPRDARPRSQLEALALGVLRAHVPDETPRDAIAANGRDSIRFLHRSDRQVRLLLAPEAPRI